MRAITKIKKMFFRNQAQNLSLNLFVLLQLYLLYIQLYTVNNSW